MWKELKSLNLRKKALKVKNLKKPVPRYETQLPRLEIPVNTVSVMKEITQFDHICRIGKMRVSVFLW